MFSEQSYSRRVAIHIAIPPTMAKLAAVTLCRSGGSCFFFVIVMRYILIFIILFLPSICTAQESWLDRCEPYREQVQQILADSGVHPDYYFLMVAESRCTPKAESDKGAQGFWQLMPRTARKYGCNNPHDLVCATKSAANYIKRLQSEFKSFKDVIVAYNMGGHNYIRAKQPTREAIGLVQKVLRLRNDYQRFSSAADETL